MSEKISKGSMAVIIDRLIEMERARANAQTQAALSDREAIQFAGQNAKLTEENSRLRDEVAQMKRRLEESERFGRSRRDERDELQRAIVEANEPVRNLYMEANAAVSLLIRSASGRRSKKDLSHLRSHADVLRRAITAARPHVDLTADED